MSKNSFKGFNSTMKTRVIRDGKIVKDYCYTCRKLKGISEFTSTPCGISTMCKKCEKRLGKGDAMEHEPIMHRVSTMEGYLRDKYIKEAISNDY